MSAAKAKEGVLHILESLPEDASLEDIQYHIYVRQKIDHGLEDVEAGRTLSEEELDQRMAKWLEP
jgi:predicted transcriptional regulator